MSVLRRLGISFVMTLIVWLIFTWPLARHFSDGIPAGHYRHDITTQYMIPGDHLQLLYHFWLFGDMMRGETPWFTNLYEFNTGDDAERFELTYNFFPFSFLCATLSWIGGQAFGWNLTSFFSLWMTYLFTWLLARRYSRDEWSAAVAALMGIMLTYRWHALMGGSPTGFGMMWTPFLLLGLDIAVREGRWSGGLLAGITLYCASISDTHVYFFLMLFTPVWCVMAFLMRNDFNGKLWPHYRSLAVALLPVAFFGGLSVLQSRLRARELADSVMAHGRGVREIAGFSPRPEGLFSIEHLNMHSQAYIGYSITVLIALGAVALLFRFFADRRAQWRNTVFMLLLIGIMTAIAILALGPHGPSKAWLFMRFREWIPPYAMIRQAGKIYSLLPQLLAVGAAISLSALFPIVLRRQRRVWILIAIGAVMLLEYGTHVKPQICLLRDEQPAYAAVAEDARAQGENPHVLIVTLWPGDTHYTSVYEHYVSKYRIRMVNGYRPAVPQQYREEIFWYYQTINQGHLTEQQADDLLDMGVRYILVHEDLFPEQVSPFPITFTLKQLLNHPQLDFLEQGDRVWAFRILEEPIARDDAVPGWNTWFPARLWEFERSRNHEADTVADPECSGNGFLSLNRNEAAVLLRHTSCPPAPNLRWLIRARGEGRLRAINLNRDDIHEEGELTVHAPDWTWIEFPMHLDEQLRASLRLEWVEGAVDLDMALLTAGEWTPAAPGESLTLPAPLFFHAGYTDKPSGPVVFQPLTEPDRRILYGPRLPLDAGRYEVELRFASDADNGTLLGRIRFESNRDMDEEILLDVVAGAPARQAIERSSNLPFTLSFDYTRKGDIRLESIVIHRVDD